MFTKLFHRRRGRCCGNICRHCPFGHFNVPPQRRAAIQPGGAFDSPTLLRARFAPRLTPLKRHRSNITNMVVSSRETEARTGADDVAESNATTTPVDVLLWSGSVGSWLALQAALNAQDKGRSSCNSNTNSVPIVLLTTFDPSTSLLVPSRNHAGSGVRSLDGPDEPGSLRAIMNQAQALGQFNLLAAPELMTSEPTAETCAPSDEAEAPAHAQGPDTAAWANGVTAALTHLRTSHGVAVQRIYAGNCYSDDSTSSFGSGSVATLRNEALLEAMAKAGLESVDFQAPLKEMPTAALRDALKSSCTSNRGFTVDPPMVTHSRDANGSTLGAEQQRRRRTSAAEPPPLPRPREILALGPKPQNGAAVCTQDEAFVGNHSITHVLF